MGKPERLIGDDFLAFARLAPRAKTELTLQGELMKRLRPFGVTHVAAGVMADSRRNFKLGRAFGEMNFAWMRAYVDRRLYQHDPVIDHALRFERAAYWDKTFKLATLSRNAARVVSTAANLGAKDGFMTPLPLFNGLDFTNSSFPPSKDLSISINYNNFLSSSVSGTLKFELRA